MPRITISYRRDDSLDITGRIFDRLAGHFGREAVFRDIDSIPPGADFRRHIDRVLDESDIILAIVGPRWIGPDNEQPRLASRDDLVRIEIETALRKDKPLIPVLVSRAVMPHPDVLPDSLHDFVYHHAVQVDSGLDFDVHVDRLIRAIERLLRIDEERTADEAVQGAIAAIKSAPPLEPTPKAEPSVDPVVPPIGRPVIRAQGGNTVRRVLGLVVILGIIGAGGWRVLVERPAEMARKEAGTTSSSCGKAPLVADESFKASTQAKTSLLRGLIGQADLAAKVEKAQTDVFVKYPNTDKVRMDAYFAYVICTQVLTDARLSPREKAQFAVSLLPQDPGTAQLGQNAMSAIAAGDYERAEALAAAARNQVAAVLLIDDGHPDVAISNLEESERLLDGARSGDAAQERLQRGYNYKTYAEAFRAKGDTANELRYLGLALDTFDKVKDDPGLNEKTKTEFAGAINGIGNIHHQIGLYREAIADYRQAVDLLPDYAYAWHDMFLAYFKLAEQGNIDLPAMRMALAKTKETGVGVQGLDTTEIALLESMLAKYEKQNQPHRNRQ